jgi:hypothetical protein
MTLLDITPLLRIFLASVILVNFSTAFNIDVSRPIIFEDPGIGGNWNGRPSYFGFSVALHNFTDARTDPTTW